MKAMATRVEVTARETRSDILNEVKLPRTFVSPLSDASNKSSDPGISSSIIIEDTTRVPSKPVSMFSPGMRPRLSPKPFSRELPLENRRSVAMSSMFSADVKPHSDVPFQASNSISLFGSAKTDESERVGRRIFTSSYQPNIEEDLGNKSELFYSTAASRKQTSPNWTPGTTGLSDTKSTSQADERKVTSKPPLIYRKPEPSHQDSILNVCARETSSISVDEQKESGLLKGKNSSLKPERIDSSSVRAQLRPKRRPMSMFIDSVNDPTNDPQGEEDQKTWNRRPLSADLTCLFESKVFGNKKESPSEETKENRPLKYNSLTNTEDQSEVESKEEDFARSKTIANVTRTGVVSSSSRNMTSERVEKEITVESKSSRKQEIADVAENEGVVKLAANSGAQTPKTISDSNVHSPSKVKNAEGSAITPGSIKRRISLYLANTNSMDAVDVPTNKEDRIATNTERKLTNLVSDKDVKSGRPQSHPMTTDFTKKFSTSSPNLELRSEKRSEEKSVYVSQDYGTEKEKTDWRTSELSEEKQIRPRRSFRRVDERLQLEDRPIVPKERRSTYKDNTYDTETDVFEKEKKSAEVDKPVKTVKATMFEHNVERHNAAKVYPISSYTPKCEVSTESPGVKHESSSWSEWLSGDSVYPVPQLHKDYEVSDRISEKSFGKFSSSTEIGNVQRDVLQNLKKVDDNRRIEPRYEVIQSVGEKVLSESVQMAPEDKAKSLRSQRSFHKKEREQDRLDVEENFSERPASLHRSRSEYIKRRTQDSPQDSSSNISFSRDLDVPFDSKNVFRAEKFDLVKSPTESPYIRERTYLSSKNKSIGDMKVSNFQDKSYILDNKAKRENALENDPLDYSSFGRSTEDGKGMKSYFSDFNHKNYKSIRDSVEQDLITTSKTVKDEPTVTSSNVKEVKDSSPVQELKSQSYHMDRFPSDNEPGPVTKKSPKNESNDFFNVMLNQEIEQIKKDLTLSPSTKQADPLPTIKPPKEESKEDSNWMTRKGSFHNRDASNNLAMTPSDLFKYGHDESRKQIDLTLKSENKDKVNTSTVKDLPPVESKATYFAVTGVDNKKEKNYNNFESLSSSATNLTTNESSFKPDMKVSTTYSRLQSDYFTQDEKNAKDSMGTSSASKEFKTYRNQKALEDDLMGKSEKTSDRQNSIDIDALLKRYKQKPSPDDKGPSYRDSHVKPPQKSYEMEPENTQEPGLKASPLNLDAMYKSKVVDIDSLMADYNANQQKDQEKKFWGDDENLSKWESSRSFKDSVSKGSSNKWKDPPRHFTTTTTTEGYQYESVASWYTSQETTSTKDDPHKSSVLLDNRHSLVESYHEKNSDKGRDDHVIRAHPEKSQNLVTLDSLLESSVRTRSNYKARSTQILEMPPIMAEKSTPRTPVKNKLIEVRVDGEDENIGVVKYERESSIKYIPADERQPLSDGRPSRKASDLINLMLENKEKRVEQHRRLVELPQEPRTHRSKERTQWESKENSENERTKQRATTLRELETVTDPSVRKTRSRQRARAVQAEEDHVKQCFSRSSTSNKDTDSIVQEPDRQYGTWSQDKQHTEDSFVRDSPSYDNISSHRQQSHSRLSSLSHTETDQHESITEARDGSLDRSSMDLDSTEGTESTPSFNEAKAVDFSFVDQTSVLDSTALKNRVQLSRKSQRRAPSQAQRKSRLLQSSSQLAVIEDTDSHWMFTDSTEEKPQKQEEAHEVEEKPQRSSVQSQRMPMFPGMDHSTLMAQLRKRQDAESSSESSAQPSKSPKSPLPQGTLGVKLLPTSADIQDSGAGGSPQWLKELRSKKRQSQYENHS
ncbi:uncharacterized protein KIAA1671 homolog [Mixophyes fleayi]|uniref:uncharacterized protein KIAA1671 homolog n=1 Tax=Mixophyes fleayi TaxID=3061075 RepID=UPI003F4E2CFE